MNIPLIYLKGDPFQRGLVHGELARDQIRLVIEEYKILFEKEANLTWQAAKEKALLFNSVIHDHCPDLVEEIDGIAKGSDMDYVDILTLNCHSEIFFPNANCVSTTIGVPPEASGNGKTYLTQNCNWCSLAQGTLVVLEIDQAPYPSLLLLTEAGLVGGSGVNEHGLAIGFNAMPTRKNSVGLPLPLLLRQALSETSVTSSVERTVSLPKGLGACFTYASSKGTLLAMEFSPNRTGMLLSDGKALCHTNHWVSHSMMTETENNYVPVKATYARLDWARRLTQEKFGDMGKKALFQILNRHATQPDCKCWDGKAGLPSYLYASPTCAMVIDVTNKNIWVANGKPDSSNIVGYRFAK